jgi:Putative beta-lactamase-inhibitor-like, PepSY-like
MKAKVLSVFIISFFLTTYTFSQVTKVPESAKENFARQYPSAQKVDWNNDVVNVNVKFELDGEQMNAEYTNKGIWKKTEKKWAYDKLPQEVRDGFNKSKYADRGVSETVILYLPGDVEQYRLKVEKNDLQKKYLFFNKEGRLIRDAVTI